MVYEAFETYAYPVVVFFAILASFFAAKLLIRIRNKEYTGELKGKLLTIFTLLAAGYFLWAAAEVLYEVLFAIGAYTYPSFVDWLWLGGYLFVFSGFSYFSYYMYSSRGELAKGISITAAVAIFSGAVVYYIISTYILGAQGGESQLEIFFDYFYPIASMAVFISGISVYLFFRKLKEIGVPIFLLAFSSVFDFTANMLYTYYTWNGVYGVAGVISDSLYIVYYVLAVLAFYKLSRLGTTSHKN